MQIANPPNWDLQNALNGSIPDILYRPFQNKLERFFELGRRPRCGLRVAGYGLRVARCGCGVRVSCYGLSVAECGDFDLGSCPPVFRRVRILDWNLMDYELRGPWCVLHAPDIKG